VTAPIALTCGDPRGVGAEVAAAALGEIGGDLGRFVLIGPRSVWAAAAALRAPGLLDRVPSREPPPHPLWPDLPEVGAVEEAVSGCRDGRYRAVVTGPVHKQRLLAAGFPYAGHTPWLGALCGARPVMAFAGGELVVALVTVHLPLRAVADALREDAIVESGVQLAGLLRRLGRGAKLAVLGVNPHAGEGGALGDEDGAVITPAVAALSARGLDVEGPLPADTAFAAARRGRYDGVVAMYHDQGLAPLKAVDFGRTDNNTLGLDIVRTSVDHGTALDIAWRGVADASSQRAAIDMALRLLQADEEPLR
jgi:4-hydroxythreonine-4-phosphate dehydrogenase